MIKTTHVFAILFCFYLSSIVVHAQSKVDSLLMARQSANHDSVRVEIDIFLCDSYRRSNSDSAIFYGKRALELSRTAPMRSYPQFENKALTFLGQAYGYSRGKTAQGIEYIKQAIPYYQRTDNKERLVYNYFKLGILYFGYLYDYDSAVKYYNEAIAVADDTKSRYFSGSFNNGGLAYYYLGDYEKAINYGIKAVELRSEKGSAFDVACSILNVGMAYHKLTQYEDAKIYYTKALNGFVEAGHAPNEAVSYKNLADVLMSQDSLNKALEFYNMASEKFKMTNNNYLQSDCFLNMGTIFVKLGEYQKAEDFLLNAEATVPARTSDRFKSQIYSSLADTKKAKADSIYKFNSGRRVSTLKEGAFFGEKAWALADSSNSNEVKILAAESLVDIYEALNMFEEAFKYAKLLNEVNIETGEKTQSDAMARMATEFETERVENENTLLQESQRTQAARLKQQSYLIYGTVIGLILILIIVLIIYRSRLKLKSANQTIEKSLSEKELLLKEIHHRVKNNLQVVSGLLELQSRSMENKEAMSTLKEGQNRVKAMALIHQKLYQNEDLATIDFAEYASNLMKELAALYPNAKDVKTSLSVDGNTHLDIDTAIPLGLILNELISNAYKYAFKESTGELKVTMESLENAEYRLVVGDTGTGLPDSFDFMKAKSFGLRLVRRLSRQLYGKVTYSLDAGAKFEVTFVDVQNR